MNEQSRSGWNKIEPEIKEKIVKSMSSPSSLPSPTSNLLKEKVMITEILLSMVYPYITL